VRLSLFARLFSRNKPQPVVTGAAGGSTRLRGDLGGSSARHDDSSFPAASFPGATFPAKSRLPPAAVDAQPMVSAAEPAQETVRGTAAFGARQAPARPSHDEEVVKATKMAPQEELSLKISEGLKNLSTVLGAIDEKLAGQARTSELVADRLQALPRVLEGLVDAERSNLEMLGALRASMDRQGEASRQTAERLDQLPSVVDGLGTRIQQQTEASAAVKTSVESVSQSVRGLVDVNQRAQNGLITEFRRGQDEQRHRLEELVDRQRKTILIVAGLGIVVVVALVIVLTRLPPH